MKPTQIQKDMLLQLFFHYCKPEMRRILMRELPQAYNAYCGEEIVKVVHTDTTYAGWLDT